jgi:soluble lytic murein transglycosylase
MNNLSNNSGPNRGAIPALSSGRARFLFSLLLLSAPAVTAPLHAQTSSFPSTMASAQPNAIGNAISQWRALSQADNYSFSTYANFLISNPGFPDETVMRRNAEKMLRGDIDSAELIVSFFRKFPALTPTANLRFAEALSARGFRDEAKTAARAAWLGGALSPLDESRILSSFADSIQPGDHDARMNRLLWDRSATNALSQIALVSTGARPIFEARLAMQMRSADASSKVALIPLSARNDAGFIADQNLWYRNSGQLAAARALLAAPRQLTTPPLDPDKWLSTLLASARAANNDYQYDTAYNIARQMGDTYPAGTVVSDRPFSERDAYTDLAWIGGQAALTKLGRARDAIALFNLYAGAARSAQTRAKGHYWAGRAADAAGQRDIARSHYQNAGQYFDQFHGQLALERLGLSIAPSPVQRTVMVSGADRDAFEGSPLVRAAKYLGTQGQWFEQSKFIRVIAANANTDLAAILATELSQKINRPDLAVMIGRNARTAGLGDYLKTAFPQVTVPGDVTGSWTMIHAITRQESQFDRQIISRAGARGLMQLMPGTARETARLVGVGYDLGSLYEPGYNIRLGSTYFGTLMDRYSGSYLLAVCAYNAGPGNVNKWIAANGDPRIAGADVIGWIERIPLSETRNYVQRVLENAVIYDLLNPGRANIRSGTPLSAYLGKSQPG